MAIAGRATFDGCLAVATVSPTALRAVLPRQVSLPPEHAGCCRCLLAFGEHRDATPVVGGVPLSWRLRYYELMAAVPFVSAADRPWLYVLGMACDLWSAVWSGNAYYGFRKRLVPLGWDGRRFWIDVRNMMWRVSWPLIDPMSWPA